MVALPTVDFLVLPVAVGVVGLNLIGETFRLVGGDVTVALFGAGLLLRSTKIPVTKPVTINLCSVHIYKHSMKQLGLIFVIIVKMNIMSWENALNTSITGSV